MKPQYEPKTFGQKLGYLVEECGEVLAAVGKTIRWGPESYNPEIPEAERETNAEWVLRELYDLERGIRFVREALAPHTSRPPPPRRLSSVPPPSRKTTENLLGHIEAALADQDPERVESSLRESRAELATLLDVNTELRLELDRIRDGDAAAMEVERWRDLLRKLIASLPRCDHCTDPATRAPGRGGPRFCDRHGPPTVPDYPRARVLREAVDALRKVSLT